MWHVLTGMEGPLQQVRPFASPLRVGPVSLARPAHAPSSVCNGLFVYGIRKRSPPPGTTTPRALSVGRVSTLQANPFVRRMVAGTGSEGFRKTSRQLPTTQATQSLLQFRARHRLLALLTILSAYPFGVWASFHPKPHPFLPRPVPSPHQHSNHSTNTSQLAAC